MRECVADITSDAESSRAREKSHGRMWHGGCVVNTRIVMRFAVGFVVEIFLLIEKH